MKVISTPYFSNFFYMTQKLAKLKSQSFVTFPNIYAKKIEKLYLSEPLRGQRSAAGNFNGSSGDITYWHFPSL